MSRTTGEALRERISRGVTDGRWGTKHHDEVAREIAAAIVSELGITRSQARMLYAMAERAAAEDGDLAPHYQTWVVADVLTALLDCAEVEP